MGVYRVIPSECEGSAGILMPAACGGPCNHRFLGYASE